MSIGTWSQLRKKDHVTDRMLIGQQHHQAVDANAESARRRHAVLQGDEKVLVEGLCLDVALLSCADLIEETLTLHARIIQLRKRVGVSDSST